MNPWDSAWEEIGPLGKGGQGVTIKVARRSDKKLGALKKLKNNKNAQQRARMKREVSSLQLLSVLNATIATTIDDNTAEFEDLSKQLYIVTDFIPGATLKEYVETSGPLDIDRAIGFCQQICQTVQIAHKASILHRDIKPDNIIVKEGETGEPKLVLIDFGLSFNTSDDDVTETLETFRNKFLDLPENNTPGGARRDHRSDVTAIAAVLYYMLTSHSPGHLTDQNGRLPHMRPGYRLEDNPELKGHARFRPLELILSQAFQPLIESRLQSVEELQARLLETKSFDATVATPVATAAFYKARFELNDVKTRMQRAREAVDSTLPSLIKAIRKYAADNKLLPFKLEFQSGSNVDKGLPEEFVNVANSQIIHLELENHGRMRSREYRIGICKWQYSVFATTMMKGGGVYNGPKRLLTFSDVPADVVEILFEEFVSWLDSQFHSVATEVLPD